ncbi:hypothetical protein [Candidatus Entotheonella palauensis]|uniref:hypothetical protein n=1 Tax=Candidatus Entotheonella palauensis TaxID=93172 RepID=UPI000B7CF849|nr:hypothetical protein [Candidatus Entotheonella palauensis]
MKANWDGLKLFDDVPKRTKPTSEGASGADDPCRLGPVVEILYQHVRDIFRTPPSDRQAPLRLGLLDGLGQGKTSVVHQVKNALSEKRLIPTKWCRR